MNDLTMPGLLPPGSVLSGGGQTREDGSTGAAKLASDFETFLTLLTSQMQNQDPLKPIESTEFVAQLANFSTVEQLIATNARLDTLAASAAGGTVASLSSWIGLDVAAVDGSFRTTGSAVEIAADPVSGATAAELEIVDTAGVLRARLSVDPGAEVVTWSGKDADGVPVADEVLRAKLVYRDGETVIGETPGLVFARIDAIDGNADGASLRLADGRVIAPGDVAALRRPDTREDAAP